MGKKDNKRTTARGAGGSDNKRTTARGAGGSDNKRTTARGAGGGDNKRTTARGAGGDGDVARLRKWTREHREDPDYRARERAKSRARAAQLKADAEYGRKCRELIKGIQALFDLVKQQAYNNKKGE